MNPCVVGSAFFASPPTLFDVWTVFGLTSTDDEVLFLLGGAVDMALVIASVLDRLRSSFGIKTFDDVLLGKCWRFGPTTWSCVTIWSRSRGMDLGVPECLAITLSTAPLSSESESSASLGA